MPRRSCRSMVFPLLAATSAQTHRNPPGQTDRHLWKLHMPKNPQEPDGQGSPSTPTWFDVDPRSPNLHILLARMVRRQVDITRHAIHRSASFLAQAKSPRASLAYLSTRPCAILSPCRPPMPWTTCFFPGWTNGVGLTAPVPALHNAVEKCRRQPGHPRGPPTQDFSRQMLCSPKDAADFQIHGYVYCGPRVQPHHAGVRSR